MRSGDRPGLQNRRAAGNPVTGGFDPHSLPPSTSIDRLLRGNQRKNPKTRIGTQRVELERSVQSDQAPIVFSIGDVEPLKSLLFVSQVGVEAGNDQRRVVAILTLCFPELDGLGESALPA